MAKLRNARIQKEGDQSGQKTNDHATISTAKTLELRQARRTNEDSPASAKGAPENIIKGRRFKKVEDVVDITGVGEKTFDSIIKHSSKL